MLIRAAGLSVSSKAASMPPVYVVGGYMRSGTSMMMKALEAGGMQVAYRASREEMRLHYADSHYDPNVGGLYELERADYLKPDFPCGYEGKVVKVLRMGVAQMGVVPSGIRVLFMRRDTEEIRQSYMAFFGRADVTTDQIDAVVSRSLTLAKNRRDTLVMEVPFRGVVESPAAWFGRICDFGFGIDVAKAAAIVDENLLRYRYEDLEVGIV